MKSLTLRLPAPQWRRAMALARQRGVSISAVIRVALDEYLTKHLGPPERKSSGGS